MSDTRHTFTICLHGPESTGKSSLAKQLGTHFGAEVVPEYGRIWCEQFGTNLSMADLVTIGQTHDSMTWEALGRSDRYLVVDTDPLMTAVWADMIFGKRDPWFAGWHATADYYLLLDIDLPWVDDGTRLFGADMARKRFFDLSRAELERRGVRYDVIGGKGPARFANALAAIEAAERERP